MHIQCLLDFVKRRLLLLATIDGRPEADLLSHPLLWSIVGISLGVDSLVLVFNLVHEVVDLSRDLIRVALGAGAHGALFSLTHGLGCYSVRL